jgi:hypothetical protein
MSWDVILYNLPSSVTSLEKYYPQPLPLLGSKSNVIRQLKEVFPDIRFSDPDWGYIERSNYSIEFNFGKEDPLDSLMLHVRGNENVIAAIRAICESASWRAFDTTTGLFMDFENDPARGLREWRSFRDKVFNKVKVQGEEIQQKGNFSFVIKKKKLWWQFWK